MRSLRIIIAAAAICFAATAGMAQDAVTASCKDGTSYSGARRSGACRGHGGVAAFGAPGSATP